MTFFKWLQKNFVLLHMFLGIVFLTSGFIVCFMMLMTFVFIKPFNKSLYRKIIYMLASSHWSQFTFFGQWWSESSSRLILHDINDFKYIGKEHSLVVMNHKYDIDWLMVWVLSQRLNMLGGTKVYVKSSLRFMPLLGWAWFFAESIFLQRDWAKDKVILKESLGNFKDYPDKYWFTLLLFCEGTRFTELKHQQSMKFAQEHNLPCLKHHLLPRTRGFYASVLALQGKVPAILDLTLAFEEGSAPPNMLSILQGKVCKAVTYAKRIPLEDIPTENEEACNAWLLKHYQAKDELYDTFVREGSFKSGTEVKIERSTSDLVMWVVWAIVSGLPTAVFIANLILYGSVALQAAGVIILVLGSVVVMKLVAVSEIKSTSSSYGHIKKQ